MDERNEITTIQTDDYIGSALADGFSLDDVEWIKEHSNLSPAEFFRHAHKELEEGKTLQQFKNENEIPLTYDIDKSGKLIAATTQLVASDEAEPEVLHALQMVKSNTPAKTINNFLEIFLHDPYYDNFRYNVLTRRAEKKCFDQEKGKLSWEPWTDIDEAMSKKHIEDVYGLYNNQKYNDAFKTFCNDRMCNPVTDMLRNLPKWDGEERCKYFLETVLNTDRDSYTRFASQLIFDSAVSRAFDPGCKMDLCVVLIGLESGEGKSTIVRWLAMDDNYAGEITNISQDMKSIIEEFIGRWIVEIGEFLLPENRKIMDATKAFITRTQDTYRTPYSIYTNILKRSCIFIATTNHREFLSDPTGNRRWLPVVVHSDGLFVGQEKAVREYIRQCYAEAVYRYDNDKCLLYVPHELRDEVKKQQGQALMEDGRIGVITDYCEHLDYKVFPYVCAREIWRDALGFPLEKYGRKQQLEINEILRSIPYLEEQEDRKQFQFDGRQRCFRIIPEKMTVEN